MKYNLNNTIKADFWAAYKKNKGQFCLTAVAAELKLQSNTLTYNGCPMPPAKYVPWTLSRNTPEKVRARKEEARRREEMAKNPRPPADPCAPIQRLLPLKPKG